MMTVELKIVNTKGFPIAGRATVWFFSEDLKPSLLVPQLSGISGAWVASQCSVPAVARLHEGSLYCPDHLNRYVGLRLSHPVQARPAANG
jgi:hypothetical protein